MTTNAKFKGHGAAVLCLDLSSPSQSSSPLLLSGSEDGTARLWDLRDHRRRACMCIKVPGGGDVLSAVFAPRSDEAKTIPNETTAFGRDCSVYLGVENTVLEYDLRHTESPLILSEPTKDWSRLLQNQDEVNQISLAYYNKDNDKSNNTSSGGGKKKKNQKKKGGSGGNKKRQQQSSGGERGVESLYLAACDDAGKIRWTESLVSRTSNHDNAGAVDASANSRYENHGTSTILHHDNHGVAVVPACSFRPVNNTGGGGGSVLELASGGTDCKIQLWDVFRPKKPLSTFVINQNNNEEEKSKPQVCNPPFVYSLNWSNNGKSLAAGLGDGTVGVFEINNRTLVQSQLLVGNEGNDGTMHYAHESSVASVVYPSFSAPTSDRILCSAGSDGSIVFWDLGTPNDVHWEDDFEDIKNKNCDSKVDSTDVVDNLLPTTLLQALRNDGAGAYDTNTTTASHNPRILFDISHGQKINWITRALQSNNTLREYNGTIFVGDTSSEITSYTIPF
mmetsp:Transcript_9712/g.23527  ORF Transcript_9712/g.23527 Transcript_9712/m.23527 type:complete len:505 (-) Transcript_9712:566-2080(-)